MKFYRYEAVQYASMDTDHDGRSINEPSIPNPQLVLHEYNMLKETPKGYWIGYGLDAPGNLRSEATWVSKTSRKRFAYPTKEEALKNFELRTKMRIRILKYQLEYAQAALALANTKS